MARQRILFMPSTWTLLLVAMLVAVAFVVIASSTGLLSHNSMTHKFTAESTPTSSTSIRVRSTTESSVLEATLACHSQAEPATATIVQELVGLSVDAAQAQAAAKGQNLRVVAQDGTCNDIFTSIDASRIALWVVNGSVVKAVLQ